MKKILYIIVAITLPVWGIFFLLYVTAKLVIDSVLDG